MKFTYETQGAVTYLVCELGADDQIDTLTLGMLTNNHINGVASTLYTEMNGQRFFKYNVSAKVSSDQFFSAKINKQRLLNVFKNILSSVCSADDYMIDQNCFSILPEHVFLNVSSCETSLICIPVETEKNINSEMISFFKKVMCSVQFDDTENMDYVDQINDYIDNTGSFNLYEMNDLINRLQNTSSAPKPAISNPTSPQSPQSVAPQVTITGSNPNFANLDSTISIEDMPSMLKPQSPVSVNPIPQPSVMSQPAKIPAQRVVPVAEKTPSAPKIVPPATNAPELDKKKKDNMAFPKPTVNNQRQNIRGNEGFAIPGQAPFSSSKPNVAQPSVNTQQQINNKEKDKTKKMSLFGLLSNYSKENAEIYKQQKAEAKAKKKEAATNQPPAAPTGAPNQFNQAGYVNNGKAVPPQTPFVHNSGMTKAPFTPNNGMQQSNIPHTQAQFTQPQTPPPIMPPMNIQMNFDETTVLSPFEGGETTVLSEATSMPTLTRVKNGEKVTINKSLFRIGKERSFVDYFISDNTAISRSHCIIYNENNECFVEDTNSTNHTWVNGKLVPANTKVKIVSGDKIKIANEEFVFCM